MIYTKTGDSGKSSIIGKSDIPKCAAVFDVLGDIDELSSYLGLVKFYADGLIKQETEKIQSQLIYAGAAAAGGDVNIDFACETENFEKIIDSIEDKNLFFDGFSLSGKTILGAHLDVARCVARRTERDLVRYLGEDGGDMIKYFNRLSDLLYIMARYADRNK